MAHLVSGIVPVMLTPFTQSGKIDFAALERLIDWYVRHDADALFAVCQSSEMQFLTLEERCALSRAVCAQIGARMPVIASGHISETIDDQVDELSLMANTGADALVLVSNRLDPNNAGTESFRHALAEILRRIPSDIPLGMYECPAPYRRLLSDDELKICRDTGRFVVLKDVSCDFETVKRRVKLVADSPLAIVNANAAIAHAAMKVGSKGFSGVFTNFHPDLYAWMYDHRHDDTPLLRELVTFLALVANAEPMGYPTLAKVYHKNLGVFSTEVSRVHDFDVREKFWAMDDIIAHIKNGTEFYREKVAAHDAS
ncbi:MAG: dihydrodipicolinate synthase family protein [Rhizobiaceae bacterium]|nr:dihydrodipicolinate synthase family protein [Rhizobiaceae bacterium]|tara:strand:- start:304 stop:1242 length:939 start_codon:yes stop_codon:yes gene_type:complete